MVIYYLQAVHHTSSDTTWTLSEAISKPVSQVAAGGETCRKQVGAFF